MPNIKYNNSKGNGFAVISIGIIIFICFVYLIISLHSASVSNKIKEQANFIVEFSEELDDRRVADMKDILFSFPEIKKDHIRYLNKAEAMKMMDHDMNAVLNGHLDNPFSPIMVFNLKSDTYSSELIDQLSTTIKKQFKINGIFHQRDLFDQLDKNLKSMKWIGFIFILLLILLMLFIIISIVRYKLEADKFQIKTMEIVGAKRSFIKSIYRKSFFRLWANATLTAIALLVVCFIGFYLKYPGIFEHLEIKWIVMGVVLTSIIVLLLILITTKLQIDKYISKHFYELYH